MKPFPMRTGPERPVHRAQILPSASGIANTIFWVIGLSQSSQGFRCRTYRVLPTQNTKPSVFFRVRFNPKLKAV